MGAGELTKDLPILFQGDMVTAILEDRKTQTRRTRGLKRINENPNRWQFKGWIGIDHLKAVFYNLDTNEVLAIKSPYGRRGDTLWVRENFAVVPSSAYRMSEGVQQTINPNDPYEAAIYAAGWCRSIPKWKPSIHMPRWASRITLEITGVRVERLNNISEADAIAEGIEEVTSKVSPSDKSLRFWRRYRDGGWNGYVDNPVGSYASLWTEINGLGSWEKNPWLWVVCFEVVK